MRVVIPRGLLRINGGANRGKENTVRVNAFHLDGLATHRNGDGDGDGGAKSERNFRIREIARNNAGNPPRS